MKNVKYPVSLVTIFVFCSMLFWPVSPVFAQEGIAQVDVVKPPNIVTVKERVELVEPGNVTVNFKDADIKAVLNYFSEVSDVDIVPAPEVQGVVSMKLTNKPWDVALDILVRNYGYVLVREGNIIRVVKKESLEGEEVITEVIKLNYLIPTRKIGRLGREGVVAVGDLGKEKMAGIELLQKAVKAILKPGESVTFVPSVNGFVVTAIPARIGAIKRMIGDVDVKPAQIMLEAKIVEVLLNKDDKMGIDWNVVISATGAKRPTTLPFQAEGGFHNMTRQFYDYLPIPQPDDASTTTGAGGVTTASTITQFPTWLLSPFPFMEADDFVFGTLDFTQFSAVLSMLDQKYDTSILSTPRITTLNNQEAFIKVARELFLEQVESTSETGGTVGTRFETTPREVGIFLQVIPHINEDGLISVALRPRADGQPKFNTINVQSGDSRVVMEYTSRVAQTQVMVRTGETIFIGGLINEDNQVKQSKFPILGDLFGGVPFLGKLFRYESEEVKKTEIVIFVTVHIVDNLKRLRQIGTKGFSQDELLAEYLEESMEVPEKPEKKKVNVEKSVEVPRPPGVSGMPAKTGAKKKNKPFLDFRKKKKK